MSLCRRPLDTRKQIVRSRAEIATQRSRGFWPSPTLARMRQQLRPLFDRVVIKELEPERFRRSGILVAPGSNEPPPQHGIVLAIGLGIDWWQSAGVQMPVGPGDHVVFPASAGVWIEVEEERLLVCRVGELLGVIESASERDASGELQPSGEDS